MNKIVIYSIFLSILLVSCREAFYYDELLIDAPVPVIQGRILLDKHPEVRIGWSMRFEDYDRDLIPDAEVFISDHLGFEAKLTECEGIYTTPDMMGQTGYTYTLRVVLSDGREYISHPQYLSEAPLVDSLYAVPGTRKSFVYSYYNEPVYKDEEGLFISSKITSYKPGTQYYRFHTYVIKLSSYTVNRDVIYMWDTKGMDNSYAVDFSVSDNTKQVLNHNIGFLRWYFEDEEPLDGVSGVIINAWVVCHTIYTISEDAYKYYTSVGQQLAGNDQLFAPVAGEVESNIHCISDVTERVLGIFEASSGVTVYKAFAWLDLNSCRSLELVHFPEIGDGTVAKFAPYFWIHPNHF